MRVFVLADDLTGGNGTAALLRREGLPSHTHLLSAGNTQPPPGLCAEGAHVLDLDSRECPDEVAAHRVAQVIAWLPGNADLVALRIDSTLRGPIPASLDALLTDRHRFAVLVPAFPASGRTTRDGIHAVFGTPVAETQVAHDPHCPVNESDVGLWIGARLNAAHAVLPLRDVRRGEAIVASRFATMRRSGVRAVLCDAETDRDIDVLARAAIALHRSGDAAILPADPGPFTASLLRHMLAPCRLRPIVFGIVGSVMDTSREQMDFVERGNYAFTLRYGGESAAEVLAALAAAPVTTRAMLLRTDTATLSDTSIALLPGVLSDILIGAIEMFPALRGFLLSGGEIAGTILASVGVQTLRLHSEIMPLVALSRIVDGRQGVRGRWLVTKGGAVGTRAAIAEALGLLFDVLAESGGAPNTTIVTSAGSRRASLR